MKRLVSAATLALVLLTVAGCSVTTGAYDPYTLYLLPGDRAQPAAGFIDRYACANGAPLMCRCTSRLRTACECGC